MRNPCALFLVRSEAGQLLACQVDTCQTCVNSLSEWNSFALCR